MELLIVTPKKLRHFHPLDELDDIQLDQVFKQSRVDNPNRHEIIFRQDSDDDDMIYLISGSIKLSSDQGAAFELSADAEQARYPIANIKPRKFSAYVMSENAQIARIPASLVEKLSPESRPSSQPQSSDSDSDKRILDSDWMMAMKQTALFQKLQNEVVTQLFHVMDEKTYKAGENVITQGEAGDYFYLIKQGQCEGSRTDNNMKATLAKLGPTNSFGEEALLTRSPRNATVTMLTDGLLMRISKADFEELMFLPSVQCISPADASALLKNGAIPVDLRRNNRKQTSLKNAIAMPAFSLRYKLNQFASDKKYLIICDSTSDQALASYLFSKTGLDAFILCNDPVAGIKIG